MSLRSTLVMTTDLPADITEAQLHQLIDERPLVPAQFLILAICFLLQTIDGYDVLAMAFAAPALADDWALTPDKLGIVFSAGVLGMTLGAMFLAPLTDRIGRRTMIFRAVSVMGISMLATAWVESLWSMVILRIVTGLTIGAMLASLTSLVSEFFPDRSRNMAIGILLAGYPLGATLGGFLAAALIPDFGWQGVFLAGGIMTLCLVPLVLLYLPESLHFLMRRRPPAALQEINAVLEKLQLSALQQLPAASADPEPASVRSLLTASRRRATLQLWSSFFLCFGTLYFLFSWIPKLLVDSGLPLEQAIYAGIAFNIGGVVGNISIGWVSTRLGLQKSILYFHLIAASGMVLFAYLPLGIASLLLLTGIIGLFQQGGFVGFYMTAARLYPAEIRTTGVGWGIGLGRFGAVIAPYLAGVLIAAGWGISLLFTVFSIPLVIGGWITYSIRSKDLPR
jgi:AAHS family 4-hydroxybenzoate transporter-like MFS transporter